MSDPPDDPLEAHSPIRADGPLRVAVIGAGAVGAVIAASAAAAGHRVVLCVRSPFERLVVTRGGQDHPVEATVVTEPAELAGLDTDPVDVVIVTVKAQDTASAEPWLRRLCGPDTVVVVAQNGLDHEGRVAPLVPEGTAVVAALVYVATERVGPGRVVHHSGNRLVLPAGSAATGTARSALGPELDVRTDEHFVDAVWRKLLSNIVANPVTALTMRRIDVMADPEITALARGLLEEAVATAQADAAALGAEDVESVLRLYRGYREGGSSGSSMFYDRLAGRPLEHEALTGALVAIADRHRVPVPLNRALLALLRVVDPEAERSERAAAG